MANVAPMLGAIFGISKTPKSQDKKRAKKSKGEASVTEPHQQHGELASNMEPPKPPTDKQKVKDEAKYQMRRATEDWIAGRMDTKDHQAIHERARHVLSNKHPVEFKGKTGERKGKW